MRLINITGETPAIALKKAQSSYGDKAMVVSTKEIKKKSGLESGLYELVIAVDDDITDSTNRTSNRGDEPQSEPQKRNKIEETLERISEKQMKKRSANPYARGDDVTLQLSEAVKQISKIANNQDSGRDGRAHIEKLKESIGGTTPGEAQESRLDGIGTKREQINRSSSTPNSREERDVNFKKREQDPKELGLIKKEIDKLNDKLKIIQNMFWDEKSPKGNSVVIPSEFAEIYRITRGSGMSKEHLDTIMQLTLQLMPVKMRENSILIKRYFREVLRKMIYSRKEMEMLNGKKIIMLVGPTGVGKTTTLAKLAARFSRLMDINYKVGIITLDTYRIGAYDQLMFYARKMKLSIEKVVDPPEFLSAISSLSHCDYILIDTVGSSQHDKQKIDSLKSFLNSEVHSSIDVSLVISASTKYEDLRDIYQTFSILNIDTLIVTKLDETKAFGNIFSLVYDTKKPISYLSTGQEVPGDLMCASSEYLVDCLLDGFRKVSR